MNNYKKKVRGGYIILLTVFFISFIFTLTPPVLSKLNQEFLTQLNYVTYSNFCHQLDSRSFHLWGTKLGVCARCTGIYLGFFLGALFTPIFRNIEDDEFPTPKLLIISMIPIAIDGFTQLIGLRESFNSLRFITGLIFGFTVSIYLVVLVARIFECEKQNRI